MENNKKDSPFKNKIFGLSETGQSVLIVLIVTPILTALLGTVVSAAIKNRPPIKQSWAKVLADNSVALWIVPEIRHAGRRVTIGKEIQLFNEQVSRIKQKWERSHPALAVTSLTPFGLARNKQMPKGIIVYYRAARLVNSHSQ